MGRQLVVGMRPSSIIHSFPNGLASATHCTTLLLDIETTLPMMEWIQSAVTPPSCDRGTYKVANQFLSILLRTTPALTN
jgi:hypothetical protein